MQGNQVRRWNEMDESVGTLQFTTIGDIIKKHREQASLSITQLSNLSGVHKGVISKIELGDTKRPELRTIKAISHVLEIPYQKIVAHYIDVEKRVETLKELLLEAVQFANEPLVSKVAIKLLESPQEDTYNAIEQLYLLTKNLTETAFQLLLYKIIAQYARERGVPPYVAKSLLQIYLIERLDLKQMEDSFKAGEEILYYVDFLSQEEKIIYYFRMGLQAFAIKKYKQCIELCEAGLALETTETELKARAYLAMINSYYFLDNFDAVEKHLDVFEKFRYDFVTDATKTTRGIVKARLKKYDTAIPLLRRCLDEVSKDIKIHVVTELLDVYFQTEDMDSIAELLAREEEFLPDSPQTPYKHVSIGIYHQHKGNYMVRMGQLDAGMNSYVTSLQAYGTVNAEEEIVKCMADIFSYFSNNSKSMDLHFVDMIHQVYNNYIGKNRK